jgi:hypothetical protein
MVAMTGHSKVIEKVREQLIRIMQDEELKTAVKLLADLIKDIRKTSIDLSGIHFEAQRFIPNDTQYDENYWMAAYILYLNGDQIIQFCKEVEAIDEEIIIVDEYLRMLDKEMQSGQEAIWALHKYIDKQSTFLEKVSKNADSLYKKLYSSNKVKDRELHNSIRKRYNLLDDIVHAIEDRIEKATKELEKAEEYMARMEEEYEAAKSILGS